MKHPIYSDSAIRVWTSGVTSESIEDIIDLVSSGIRDTLKHHPDGFGFVFEVHPDRQTHSMDLQQRLSHCRVSTQTQSDTYPSTILSEIREDSKMKTLNPECILVERLCLQEPQPPQGSSQEKPHLTSGEVLETKCDNDDVTYSLANVPDHLLPLAFGTDPASAGCVTKVPQAWELGGSAR